jgi:hypothetical protein
MSSFKYESEEELFNHFEKVSIFGFFFRAGNFLMVFIDFKCKRVDGFREAGFECGEDFFFLIFRF